MAKLARAPSWSRLVQRSLRAVTRPSVQAGGRVVANAVRLRVESLRPPPGPGDWLKGMAIAPQGARRYRVYRPAGMSLTELAPMVVMLHGCGQDARSFAIATRMNRIAERERFVVLYPEQDRLANAHGCWNWFETDSGRAYGESRVILNAIDQACMFYPVDRSRIAVAGLSAGASMAALLATLHPDRFRAVVMHSGIPPGTAHSTASALRAMHGGVATVLPAGPAVPASSSIPAPLPPLLAIHGAEDAVVSVKNAHAAVEAWADASGATAGPAHVVQRGKRLAMAVTDFHHGARLVAQLVQVDGLAHAWSGGAAGQPHTDPQGPDASRLAWAFIARQLRE